MIALWRQHGISETTGSTWRKQEGGVQVTAVKRLREVEHETARLKRLLAERDLEVDGLKAVLGTK